MTTLPDVLAPDALDALVDACRERVEREWPNALHDAPLDAHLRALDAWPADGGYYTPPDPVRRLREALAARGGPPLVAAYHRLVLAVLLRRAGAWLDGERAEPVPGAPVPGAGARLLAAQPDDFRAAFRGVAAELPARADAALDFGDDGFRKDLAVCLARVAFGGPRVVDLHSGLSRRALLSGPLGGKLAAAGLVARLGGHAPLCEGHIYARRLDRFTPDGVRDFWLACAAFTRDDPSLRGAFTHSWYYDPALAAVSPRLAYLRELPLRHGGAFVETTVSVLDRRDALLKSATRRRLNEEGRYEPRAHFAVWPRRALLRWADAGGPGLD